MYTVDYNPGSEGCNNVGFILSCPGKKELDEGKLVIGETGINMDILIKELNRLNNNIFKSKCRYDYLITNASNIVHYRKLCGRTEPTDSEIKNEDNINRLKRELENCNIIIACGKKANTAINSLKNVHKNYFNDKIVISTCHLGNQGINRCIKIDEYCINNDSSERKKCRINKIVRDIIEGFNT